MLELAKTTGMFYAAKHGSLGGAIFGALSEGDIEAAEAWIKEMETELHLEGPGYHSWYHMFVVRAALLRGDLERATAHQPEMMRFSFAGGWHRNDAVAHLHSAELFHLRGMAKEAHSHLHKALAIGRLIRSPYVEFMCRTIEAQIEFDRGREINGMRALARAMELGKRSGFVNSQIWIPSLMAKLCAKALEAGIEVEYVQQLIRKRGLVPEWAPVEIEAWPRPIKVYTLGRFAVLKDGQPLRFRGKAQRRPLALLKAIIALGGRAVREDVLMDALWPDSAGDAARFALNSAVHRLRRLLGHENAIARQQGEVSLDNRYCWVDLWAVERLLGRAEAGGLKDESPTSEAVRSVEKAARLYQGAFLRNDSDFAGAAAVADRLRRRLVRQLVRIARHREWSNQWQDAANCYEEAVRVDPCAEDACRHLMNTYHRLGRPADMLATYRRCRDALASTLGAAPSAETEALLKRLRV
jgi:DNA-binding SARP family transcriptional activator